MKPRTLAILVFAVAAALGTVLLRRADGPLPTPPAPTAHRQTYQCSMHPQIVSHEPGLCPICQMKLTPVDEPAAASGKPGAVPGHAPFTLSPERQQLIGVTHAPVTVRPLAIDLRAVGRVAYDPKLYQAIVEYREALHAKTQIKDSPWFEAHEGADAVIRAAALKLRQQGVAEDQLAVLRRQGGDPVNLLLPGKSVWVYAQVYEYEVELIRPGQTATISAPSLPERTFPAEVVSVDPILDPVTRTIRVRLLVETPDANLRPEAFVTVHLRVPLGEHLAVPADAVLDTGEHRIVFVVSGDGHFEPRAVALGRSAEGFREVLGGLAPGDEVVTSANFLIDSESRFRAALAAFRGHQH